MRHTGAVLLAACLLLAVGAHAQRRRTLNDENFEHITQASWLGGASATSRPSACAVKQGSDRQPTGPLPH